MRLLRLTLPLLAAFPFYASADMCDTVQKMGAGSAEQCRANTAKVGATIHDNWVTYKPEAGKDLATGKKAVFTSTSTPATRLFGQTSNKFNFLYMECFGHKRQMRLDEPGGVSLMTLKDRIVTFKIDNQPAFTETWELRPSTKSHYAPASSVLASKLKGAKKLEVTWHYNNAPPVSGFNFDVSGFDQANASLCK